jgi:predicted nucleic acid-binding protein
MLITIDTSALISIIGNEKPRQQIIEVTTGCSLCAPPSVHWEIGNALSAMFKRKSLDVQLAKQAINIYHQIPIKFIDVSLDKAVEIAHTQNMYAYDAYLIQCAQQTSTPLLTLDKGLKRIAKSMGIQILEVTP